MKTRILPLLLVLFAGSVSAAETRSAPQPRVRLDPVTLGAIVVPAPAAAGASGNPAIVLEKVVVNERKLPLERPPLLLQARGRFSIHDGGRFYGKNFGPVRVAVGFWPTIDFLASGSFVQLRAEPRLNVEMVRISW